MSLRFGPASAIQSFFSEQDPNPTKRKVDVLPPGRWHAVRVSDGVILAAHARRDVILAFCRDKDGVEPRRKTKKGPGGAA